MRALITGITGQDGAYLAQFLLQKGYDVYGTYRRLSTPNFWRLQYLGVFDHVNLIPADLIDAASIMEAINISQPTEIYHLAAQSFVGASFEQPVQKPCFREHYFCGNNNISRFQVRNKSAAKSG